MDNLWQSMIFTSGMLLPNLILMILGFFLKQQEKISQSFIDTASQLVFNYALPCLLFFSILKSNVDYHAQIPLISAGIVTTFILYFIAEVYAYFFIKKIEDKGVFVQGIFRSNMAILALALVSNAYGQEGLSIGAIYMGIITILYNILSVITLSRSHEQSISFTKRIFNISKKIITNPLIIALVSAFIYKAINSPMPILSIQKTGELLANIALPLALICAGASLDLKTMFGFSGVSMQASLGRIFVAPIVAILIGLFFRLPPMQMGILFLMVSAPVAAASYVMAKSMGGNATLAANILAFTTVFSLFSIAVGTVILRSMNLM